MAGALRVIRRFPPPNVTRYAVLNGICAPPFSRGNVEATVLGQSYHWPKNHNMTSGGSQRKGGGSVGAGGGSGRSGSRAVEEIVRHQVGDISINQRPHVLRGETRKLASQVLTEQQPAHNHNNSEIKKLS